MSGIVSGALQASEWRPSGTDGIDYAVLRPQESGGYTIFVRMAKGTHGAEHAHPGGEELYVISGDVTVGDHRLAAGAYLYTPPGRAHAIDAHADSVLLVSLPKGAAYG